MQKAHSNIDWKNFPNLDTPVNEYNLNKMDNSIDIIDNRVIYHETSKLDKTDAQELVKKIEFDRATGIFTITYFSGATTTIDTMLEKLAVNFTFDPETQILSIVLDDGSTIPVDLSALITQYEFLESETIVFRVDQSGKVSAIVKEGSVQEKHLRPDYLADIRVESAKAEQAKEEAETAKSDSKYFAKLAESHNHGGTGIREGEDTDNSKYWSEQSKTSSEEAKEAIQEVEQKGNEAVENIEQARDEAVDKINDAYDVNAPKFHVDLSTGHLLFDANNYRYIFEVNKESGHLEWRLAV